MNDTEIDKHLAHIDVQQRVLGLPTDLPILGRATRVCGRLTPTEHPVAA